MEEGRIFTKRLRAEIWTPEGCSAMALKAALMIGEGARGQETREAQRRASSGMVRARLARERATRVRAVRARGGKLLSWEGRRNCPQGKRKAPTSGRYLKESLRSSESERVFQRQTNREEKGSDKLARMKRVILNINNRGVP